MQSVTTPSPMWRKWGGERSYCTRCGHMRSHLRAVIYKHACRFCGGTEIVTLTPQDLVDAAKRKQEGNHDQILL